MSQTREKREDGKQKIIYQLCDVMDIIHAVLLTTKNIREIIDLTWPYRASWKLIGIELGIDSGTLDAINENNKKVEGCLTELITSWLKNTEPTPTRAAITAVLKSEKVSSAVGNYHIHMYGHMACSYSI